MKIFTNKDITTNQEINILKIKKMKITFRQYADGLINEKQKFIDDLAILTVSTKQTVYRWMSGESIPPKNKRVIIADYLGKTTTELWPSKSDDDE